MIVLIGLAPWNLPLWWQLRGLRFAIEADCDLRLIRRGVDPVKYGEALLMVACARSRMPLSAIAVATPVSQLERRIRLMVSDITRRPLIVSVALLSVVCAFSVMAATLDPPTAHLQKPPPLPDQTLRRGWRHWSRSDIRSS
jgi:bla regulator protein blaR1